MKPIYSSNSDDPSVGEAVDRFVTGLAERIDQLQDAEVGSDFCGVASLAVDLHADADAAGYATLAGVAAALEIACNDKDPKAARKQLIHLTEIAQRVRLGHRGSQ